MTETLCRAGLILEGGGMRGVYTAGVLDCFLDEGLFFNRCYGVSAGAGQACSYLSRQRGRGRATAMDYLRDKRCARLWSLRRTGDYFGAEFLYDLLPNEIYPYDYDAFQAYTGTFYTVVTNCDSGEAEYVPVRDMRRDIIYVRASSSLPLLSRMVEAGGRRYLDGGIADSIPLRRAEADGCEKTSSCSPARGSTARGKTASCSPSAADTAVIRAWWRPLKAAICATMRRWI